MPSGELLESQLREQPRFGEANFQLGLVLIAQKQFDKAEDLLKRVRVANPSDSRPTIALAELYGSEGQFEKAVVLLRKALDTTATDTNETTSKPCIHSGQVAKASTLPRKNISTACSCRASRR